MPEKHTSDNISDALRHAFEEWSLDEKKLACITTDNGANIVVAVELAVAELLWSQFTFGSYKRNGKRYEPHCSRNGPVSHLGQYIFSELVEEKRSGQSTSRTSNPSTWPHTGKL